MDEKQYYCVRVETLTRGKKQKITDQKLFCRFGWFTLDEAKKWCREIYKEVDDFYLAQIKLENKIVWEYWKS